MPAKSEAQRRLMGMALAYKRGDLKDASDEVKKLASELTDKQLSDFAESVKESTYVKKFDEFVNEAKIEGEEKITIPEFLKTDVGKKYVEIVKNLHASEKSLKNARTEQEADKLKKLFDSANNKELAFRKKYIISAGLDWGKTIDAAGKIK